MRQSINEEKDKKDREIAKRKILELKLRNKIKKLQEARSKGAVSPLGPIWCPTSDDSGNDTEEQTDEEPNSCIKSNMKLTDYSRNERNFKDEPEFWQNVLSTLTKVEYGYYKIPAIELYSVFAVRTSKWKVLTAIKEAVAENKDLHF